MRNPIKALVAMTTGLVFIAMMATPASAATYDFELTSGTIDVYEFLGSTPLFDVDLAGDSEECPGGSSTLEVLPDLPPPASGGTITGSITSVSQIAIPGPPPPYTHLAVMTLTFSGTWSAGPPASLSITASASVELFPLEGDCDPDEEAGSCEIEAVDIDLTGVFSSGADPQALVLGDSVTVTGGNDDGELTVIDNGNPDPVCGPVGGADFGRVVVDAVLTII